MSAARTSRFQQLKFCACSRCEASCWRSAKRSRANGSTDAGPASKRQHALAPAGAVATAQVPACQAVQPSREAAAALPPLHAQSNAALPQAAADRCAVLCSLWNVVHASHIWLLLFLHEALMQTCTALLSLSESMLACMSGWCQVCCTQSECVSAAFERLWYAGM